MFSDSFFILDGAGSPAIERTGPIRMGQYLAHMTQATLVLIHCRRGRCSEHFSFESGEEGEAALDALLSSRKPASVAVLLDLPNERFLPGTLPHVRGADGRRLRARELHRVFPESDCCRVECQDRRREGRRDDRVLYSGFDEQVPVRNWFQIFFRRSVSISRLYSSALLAPLMLRHLTIKPPHCCLLVTRGLTGFRQTLVVDGWTRFSRVFEHDSSVPGGFWECLEHEKKRVMDYFQRHALLDQTPPLVTVVISDPTMLPDVRTSPTTDTILARAKSSSHQLFTTTDLALADQLALRALLSWRLPPGYSLPGECRHLAHKMRVREYANRAALGVVLVGIAMISAQYARTEAAAQRLSELDKSLHDATKEHERVLRQLPLKWPALVQVQDDMAMHEQLQWHADSALKMLDALSHALLANPQVVVDSLSWTIANTPDPVTGHSDSGGTASATDIFSDPPTVRMDVLGHLRDPVPGSVVREIKTIQALVSELEAFGLETRIGNGTGHVGVFEHDPGAQASAQVFRLEVRSIP